MQADVPVPDFAGNAWQRIAVAIMPPPNIEVEVKYIILANPKMADVF